MGGGAPEVAALRSASSSPSANGQSKLCEPLHLFLVSSQVLGIFLIYCSGLAPRCILGAFFSRKALRENRSHDRFELRFPSLDFHLFEMEGATRSWPAIRLCMRQASCQSVRLSARGFESLPQRHLFCYAAKHLFSPFLPLWDNLTYDEPGVAYWAQNHLVCNRSRVCQFE